MGYEKIITVAIIGILVYIIPGAISIALGTGIYEDFPVTNFTINQNTSSHYIPEQF